MGISHKRVIPPSIKGYAWIASAATLWGLIGPLSRFIFNEGILPLEVAFWRAVLTGGCFFIHAAISRDLAMPARDLPRAGVFALLAVTLFYTANLMAIKTGGAAFASVMLYTAPAWVAVFSMLIFRERIRRATVFTIALTLAGVTGISCGQAGTLTGGVSVDVRAVFWGLLSGFSYSMYYLFGKYFSERYPSQTLFTYILPLGALTLYPLVTFSPKSPTAWGFILVLAFFCTYGAYYCYYAGLGYLAPTRAVITATLEPVVAAVFAFFLWGEYFRIPGYVGCCLILAAVLINLRSSEH